MDANHAIEKHRHWVRSLQRTGFVISTMEMVPVGRKPSGSRLWECVPHYRCYRSGSTSKGEAINERLNETVPR